MPANSKEAFESLLDGLDPVSIRAHHHFLADRLLEGRGVGSRGGRIAENYIEAAFRRTGLLPIGDSYRQPVVLTGLDPRPSLGFELPDGGRIVPTYKDQFVMEAGIAQESVDVESDLLFVGFGITAPEYDWDDFGDLDVRGKVLLIRVNDPGTGDDADFFQGTALTYYGRWTYKFEEAARRGAAGALLIHTEESAGYGWNVVRSSNTGEQFDIFDGTSDRLQVRGWITEDLARSLIEGAGADYDALIEESNRPGFQASDTGIDVSASVSSVVRSIDTANIVGMVPGSDASRSAEPIVFMSHHDHLGTSTSEDGETLVYPGAYDNASGVALLLAMAEAVTGAGYQFARPLVFIASTAEESGLLGSKWYSRNPLIDLAGTAAVLNVDGANLEGPTDDIAPLGVDRSSLGELVRRAAAQEGLSVTPEQHPEQGMFFRQDHFPFARAGIPAIAFDHGLKYTEKPEGWGEQWYREFVRDHYHQPTDALRDDFDYRGAIQQGRVMLRVAAAVASATDLPDWLPDSEFSRPAR